MFILYLKNQNYPRSYCTFECEFQKAPLWKMECPRLESFWKTVARRIATCEIGGAESWY